MGGSSVPSSTSQYQQLATGIWGSPQATKLALPILKPALANIKNQQDMLMGFQKGDPAQTRKFLGLPEGASSEETLTALNRANNPVTSQVQYQPPAKTAAQGGLMSLEDEPVRDPRRGYAPGGDVKSLTSAQRNAVLTINKAIEAGTVTKEQIARLDKIEKSTGLNVSPYSETGTGTPKNPKIAKSVDSAGKAYQASPAGKEKTALLDAARKEGLTASDAYINEAGKFGFDPKAYEDAIKRGDLAGVTTNPLYSEAIRQLQSMQKLPGQFDQATSAYTDAIAGLKNAAMYSADKVTTNPYAAARMTAPEQAAVKDYEAARMDAATMQGREAQAAQMAQYQQVAAQKADTERAAAAAMNRGDVREVNALMAQVEKYNAALMNAPADIKAQAYEAAQTQGPQSWTDVGTAQKFMNPYMQNVTDIAKRESMRDYGKQLSQLRSQATQSKAFGGTRAAIQEAEAQRNQQQRMGDIEAQGLNEAYKSGMGQFSAEQGLGAQVGMSNTQAMNQQRSQYVAQALEAAKNNYGGQLTAEQQNQVAQNAASQFNAAAQNLANNNYVAQQLQAQLANQQMDFGVGQMNTQNQQQTNLANAAAANQANQQYAQLNLQGQLANQQAGLTTEQQNAQMRQQAELANQQYGLGGFQSNLQNAQFSQQANQANQAAINQQRNQYVNNALQAAMQAYGGQLTAEQQNQAAANAASQFNAQQNLQGQMANQQAGLQANQQNIGAYGAIGNMGQGLGALGAQIGNYNANLANMWGQAGGTLQGLGSSWYNQQAENARNVWGGPTNLGGQGVGILGGVGGGQSGVTAQTNKQG